MTFNKFSIFKIISGKVKGLAVIYDSPDVTLLSSDLIAIQANSPAMVPLLGHTV